MDSVKVQKSIAHTLVVILLLGPHSLDQFSELLIFDDLPTAIVLGQPFHVFDHVELDKGQYVIVNHDFLAIVGDGFHEAL